MPRRTVWLSSVVDRATFEQVGSPKLVGTMLSDSISALHENGFVVLKNQFSTDQADAVVHEYHRFLTDSGTGKDPYIKSNGRMMRLANFHVVSPCLQQAFLSSNDVVDVARTFFAGRDPAIYTSLFFQEGTQQDIHRDAPLFCTFPENQFLGCWFALEGTDSSNGALRVMRGGHKLASDEYFRRAQLLAQFRSEAPDRPVLFSETELWMGYQEYVQERCAALGITEESLEVEKGDVIIWHPLLPHGGSPIQDPGRTRYSVVFHVVPVHETVYGNGLFFAPHEFTEFSEAPAYVPIQDSALWMQDHQPGFMCEG